MPSSSDLTAWSAWQQPSKEAKSINAQTIIAAIIGAAVGGSGIVGLAFLYIRRFIDNRLGRREQENAKKKANRLRRLTLEDELEHATGRLFFHIYKAIVTGQHNGDLEKAFSEYQDVERRLKELDREILVENEMQS